MATNHAQGDAANFDMIEEIESDDSKDPASASDEETKPQPDVDPVEVIHPPPQPQPVPTGRPDQLVRPKNAPHIYSPSMYQK